MVTKLKTRRNEVRKGKLRGKRRLEACKGLVRESGAGKTFRIFRGGAKV